MNDLKAWAGGAWVGLASLAAMIHRGWIDPGRLNQWTLCPFKYLTGLPCPGCGMGHALLEAFQGHWRLSMHDHALGIPFLGAWTIWLFHSFLRGLGIARPSPIFSGSLRQRLELATLGLVLAVYVIRWV